MSDIYVHLKAAYQVFENSDESVQEIIKNHPKAFNLGAQGPDFLFYHRIYPWTAKSKLKKFGEKIHSESINEFFISGFKIIKETKSEYVKSLLSSYFYGFLTHYAIDTKTHPFIFYYSGHEGGHNHKYFECLLDTCMAKETKNAFSPTHKKIKLSLLDRSHIARFVHENIFNVFDQDTPIKAIEQSMSDMVKVLSMLRDPLHVKKPLIKSIDKVSKSDGKLKTAIFPRVIDSSIDYFNSKHEEWYHPCPPHKSSTASFVDLVEEGELFGIELIKNAENFMEGIISKDTFEGVIQNLGYDTGIDISNNPIMSKSKKMVQYK
jgi:hypothetical protein